MATKRKAIPGNEVPAKNSRVEEVLTRGNNALMQLNEIGIKGLKWTIQQINNIFPQRFKGTCLFTEPFTGLKEVIVSGASFSAEGSSKTSCRHEIANQIMIRLSGNDGSIQKPVPEKPVQQQPLLKEIFTKPPVTNVINNTPRLEDAVRLLHEKVTDMEYNYKLTDHGYCCYVSFRGFMIQGMGGSKKVAKRNVAMQILEKHFKYSFSDDETSQSTNVDSTTTMDVDKLPFNRRKNFSDQIQSMVKNGFEKLVSNLEVQYAKRKVLAGIVLSRRLKVIFPQYHREDDNTVTADVIDPLQFYMQTGWTINPDDSGEVLKLITISSGTKCLSGGEINSNGEALNDCHAEVISKRALQLFLLRTVQKLISNVHPPVTDVLYGTDVLESYSQDNHYAYRLKADVRFHLYVSSSPCGDSRIFFPQAAGGSEESDEEADEDSHPNRKNRGVLRTKIECGEGTIPIKTNILQTWDGILVGERLLTMSCSDKVCLWNVLGLQGALLSNLLSSPVYLDSITIGSLFQQDHSQRALFGRARGVTEDDLWRGRPSMAGGDAPEQGELIIGREDQVDPFRVHGPWLLTVTDQDERCPGKASSCSANWVLGEGTLEVVSTSGGRRIDGEASRLAKRSLLRLFLDVFLFLPYVCPGDGVCRHGDMKALAGCPDGAVGGLAYLRKKAALLSFFERQNLGRWVGKPLEQDWFGLRAASPANQ